ncbi:MAG: hypothetical protein CVU47_06425 [Chloroflexi bacterium HGW-Chloroflexi-9]|nr:MAG: hypothetical protein CVU47_06425 [Chloroflexi bacterium HGW-Chloroflexi-9]
MLVEYRKRERLARSLGYVVSEADGLVFVAGTLDGRQPMGLVTIEAKDVVRVAALSEGEQLAGRGVA